MDFGQALAVLKKGGRVRRRGWRNSAFIALIPETASHPAQLTEHDGFGAATYLLHAWYPPSADLLARDWANIEAEDTPPAPAPTRPGVQEGLLFSFEIRHDVMSETGFDRLAAAIGGRLAQGLRQQARARPGQEPRP